MPPFRSRRADNWAALACLLSILIFAGSASAGKGTNRPPKKRQKLLSPSPSGSPGEQSLTNIPLPIGHEAKGLVLPDFDLQGRLRGKFVAGSARRLDQEHVAFQDLKITTFTPEARPDLQVDLPTSIFDLKTRVLTSKTRGTISRADFNIVGDAVEFDTNARTGRMIGNVKMVITGQSSLVEKKEE
jgi:hypothetical protein